MPTFAVCAISLSALVTPPRVGSRSTWMLLLASNIASTSPFKGAVSLAISVSNSKPSRTDMIAMPCTAIVPLMMILSPPWALPG